MDEQRSPPTRELEQGAGVGASWRPPEHEVDSFRLLEQCDRDLARAQAFPNVSYQKIDHGRPAECSRHLLTESGQSLDELQAPGTIRLARGGGEF